MTSALDHKKGELLMANVKKGVDAETKQGNVTAENGMSSTQFLDLGNSHISHTGVAKPRAF